MRTDELKIIIKDIETYRECILLGGYIPHQDRMVLWEISARKNELDAAIKFLLEEPVIYVGFNLVGFDAQVLQYTLDNYHLWQEKTALEICALVYEFVQNLINDQQYEVPLPYKEQHLDIQCIDLFLVLHMNNENRMTSLKHCMYAMDEDIEIMPVDHGKVGLTSEDIDEVIRYWENDIRATYKLWKWCIGDCEHEVYKGKDKIQLRLDLIEEYKLSHTAMSWNDVKIGAELNKKNYLELAGISNQQLWDRVKNKKGKTGFRFADCYPEYYKFETAEFREFFSRVGNAVINLNQKQEFPFSYKGTDYMFARGGGHSQEKARMIIPTDRQVLIDCDVSSMYPNIIRKRGLYPAHLGKLWNEAYVSNIQKRLDAKRLYKETKEKKYDNFQECYKLVLNGNFGRLIDRRDYQYDAFAGMCVTIGGEIDIFMLAEDIAQIPTAKVMSMNTDGLTVLLDRDHIEEYIAVCKAWEQQVGNDVMGNLEYIEYEKLVQTSVNDYIAVKKGEWKEIDGKFQLSPDTKPVQDRLKKKGDWLTAYDLHKNKSKSIVPIAMEQYIVYGTPVETTIRNHRNIYDFGIMKKASKDYSYIGVDRKTGQVNTYHKLIRYYCSIEEADGAEKLYKVKNEGSEKTGRERSECDKLSKYQVVFNHQITTDDWEKLHIDYTVYEDLCYKLIAQIQPEVIRDRKEKRAGLQTLF